MGADLKFINEMVGLGACNSTSSCARCKCMTNGKESEIRDHTKKWSMTDVEHGARTNEEIEKMNELPKSKNDFCCLHSPVLSLGNSI